MRQKEASGLSAWLSGFTVWANIETLQLIPDCFLHQAVQGASGCQGLQDGLTPCSSGLCLIEKGARLGEA